MERITEIDCCICMEKSTDIIKSGCSVIKCYTCDEGFICNDCIPKIDPHGSIYLSKRRALEKAIRCPCCRTLNWNYHYNQLIGIILEVELPDNEEEYTDNKALQVFFKNRQL